MFSKKPGQSIYKGSVLKTERSGSVLTLKPRHPSGLPLLSDWNPGLCWGVVPRSGKYVAALCRSSLLVPGVWPVSLDSRLLWVEGCWGSFSACLFPGFFPSGVETVLHLLSFPWVWGFLERTFLRSCVPSPLIFQVNRIGSCVIVPFSDYVQKGSRVLSG